MPTFVNGAMAVHKQAGGRLRGVAAIGLGLLLVGATLVGTTGSGVMATAGAAVRPLAQRQVSDRSGGVQSSPLVRITYSLVRDSGGEGPQKGAGCILLFSANGEAYLYLADPPRPWATSVPDPTTRASSSSGSLPRHQHQRHLRPVNAPRPR